VVDPFCSQPLEPEIFDMLSARTAFMLAVCFLVSPSFGQDAANVTVQSVKYEGLKAVILNNRGKVVLVDFWANNCPPCKGGFPKVVALHQKYAAQGLAVVSVNLDALDVRDRKEKSLTFLQSQGAAFTNILLEEPDTIWQDKLHFNSIPTLYLFDRQGKWTMIQPGDGGLDYDALGTRVVDLLQEKAP